jgi:malonate decarboxylase beta subunit
VSFTALTPEERVRAVLDDANGITRAGTMCTAIGRLAGRRVYIAATDPAVARGAIGAAEADGLAALLAQARCAPSPVVLLLDSSGARVDEGLPALGAFRRLFREALLARQAGLPMAAVLGRSCFGGASMLACTCHRRVYLPTTLLATSGPAIIEAGSGKAAFDASDRQAVAQLMGALARLRLHTGDALADDHPDAARTALVGWLENESTSAPGSAPSRALLAARLPQGELLPDRPLPAQDATRLRALLPRGYVAQIDGFTFGALPPEHSNKAVFIGTLTGAPLTALACWRLAQRLEQLQSSHPGSPIVLLLDALGHAATVHDEGVLLSDYLVHLSLTIGMLTHRGHRTVLWITGAASGASYVAFAAPVERVCALPAARIEVLPGFAVRSIRGPSEPSRADPAATSPAAWFAAGVADALLDASLT